MPNPIGSFNDNETPVVLVVVGSQRGGIEKQPLNKEE